MVQALGTGGRSIRTIPNYSAASCRRRATAACSSNRVCAHRRARKLDSAAVTSVAHTYFLLGDYQQALAWYPAGIRFYLDAAAMAADGRETEAAELLAHRSLLAPLVDSLRLCLIGDYDRSTQVVMHALESEPAPEPEIRFYLARHLARAGAADGALKTIRDLVEAGFFCSTALREDPWLKPLARLSGFDEVLNAVLRREAEARTAFEAADGSRVLSNAADRPALVVAGPE